MTGETDSMSEMTVRTAITLYNGVPTNMIDRLAETGISGKDCYIEFTIEDTNKVKDIMDSLELALSGEKAVSMSVDQYTRGHYYKGID